MCEACDQQYKAVFNALQALPFAAWGDVSGARLDPEEVAKARTVEIDYVGKKPVGLKYLDTSQSPNGGREQRVDGWT